MLLRLLRGSGLQCQDQCHQTQKLCVCLFFFAHVCATQADVEDEEALHSNSSGPGKSSGPLTTSGHRHRSRNRHGTSWGGHAAVKRKQNF